MAKNLVIVESPAKVNTIKKFLGKNYEVVASNGHVRDLPKSAMGIDIENDFEPKYITIRGKGEKLAELRRCVKRADRVYLATDPDREGEAIAWHLKTALKLDEKDTKRITFNEITKQAVKDSIKSPGEIDMDLVDAQQARRVLDRIVGYSISPLLWEKVKRGLSAGRVQSAALKMVCDREREIEGFIPKEFWDISIDVSVKGTKKTFSALYYGTSGEKKELSDIEQVEAVEKSLEKAKLSVKELRTGTRTKKAPLPFTTSTMQQEASKALNFSTQKTMRIAQQLYEGVAIKGRGTAGLITYLRTDSTRVSESASAAAKEYISKRFGSQYAASLRTAGGNGRKIQDAHEAIRPTDITLTPDEARENLTRDQYRLYALIWKRFTASMMKNAEYETKNAKLLAGDHIFTASTSTLNFDGFMLVYTSSDDEKPVTDSALSDLSKTDDVSILGVSKQQHFTQAPPRFSEAALVKAMEEQGIGRPSTYAPTITTLLSRRYVTKEKKNLYVTELGNAVNSIMETAFPEIVDKTFTANMEALLDEVGEGKTEWKSVIRNFYPDFKEALDGAMEKLDKIKIEDEKSSETCELCGRTMVIKYGPHGKFLACPGFPECRNTKPFLEKIGVACPKCGREIVMRMSKKGRRYFGCEGAPECDFMSWQKPVAQRCPECGEYMVEKGNRIACADKKCGYVC